MGWVATPELTAAACNAGAFGFLAAATIRPEDAGREIERVKALTDRPFGVNFLMDAPGADRIADAILRHGVRAAGYNRAPDAALIRRQKAEQLGADAVIAQGSEGGGHTGSVPTSILLGGVVDAVSVPVIAAGGYKDGRGLVAALAYGAAGVAMGTRFLLTKESPVPDATAKRYLAASVDDVIVTREIDGLPQRVVMNELVRALEGMGGARRTLFALRNALEFRRVTGASLPALVRSALALRSHERLTRSQLLMAANAPILAKRAMQDGDPVGGYLPSGSVTGAIDDRPTCAALVARIVEEAERALKALGA
jgi:nitronate monooxygenase